MSTVLFDLDGTVTDSAPGIMACLRLAFDAFDVPWPSDEDARALLGPPFWHSFPPLVGADRTEAVIKEYRRHYVDGGGMLDATVYPGIAELLAELRARDVRCCVATSKAEPYAARVLSHLGLDGYFLHIVGDTIDGDRDSKALVVGEALRRLENPDPTTVLMIGDRSHDVRGAAAHEIDCAGALWGYGSADELRDAGAVALCTRPADLLELLG